MVFSYYWELKNLVLVLSDLEERLQLQREYDEDYLRTYANVAVNGGDKF